MSSRAHLSLVLFGALLGAAIGFGPRMVGTGRACSLVEGPIPASLPIDGSTVGPRPLLVGEVGVEPRLVRADDPEGTLIPVVADEGLAGLFVGRALGKAWRPAEPLPAGGYRWTGLSPFGGSSEVGFFVDPALAAEPAALGEVDLRVILDEPTEAGCGAASSCDDVDFTRMLVTIAPPADGSPTPDVYRFELSTPKNGQRFMQLVEAPEDGLGGREILAWDRVQSLGSFKAQRFCVALTAIADDGTVGERLDLGCVNPDGDDPRVTDERPGCALGDSGEGTVGLWLGLVLITRRRLRKA